MKSGKERATRRLKERNFKLNTLLDVSNAINNTESEVELFGHFREVLINNLSLGKGVLISNINGWAVNITFGEVVEFDENLLFDSCFKFNRITVLNDVEDAVLSTFDVIIPIHHKGEALSYLLLGDFEGEKIEVSPIIRHLPFIQTLTNLIVVAQENKRLFDENIFQAAVKKELEVASRMQSMLIPDEKPNRDKLEIHALYMPHQVVGGDYYDFFDVSEHETVFCMADVSGKGISAAILMSNFQAMMHAILVYDQNLEKLAVSLNERILKNVKGEKFITAFIAIFNHQTRELKYVNSGHQPALLLQNGKVQELIDGSTVLGAFEELPHLMTGREVLLPDSKLLCFTDGVCEIENKKLEQFGTEPMTVILQNSVNKPINEIIEMVMGEIDDFREGSDFPDDLAILGVHFK